MRASRTWKMSACILNWKKSGLRPLSQVQKCTWLGLVPMGASNGSTMAKPRSGIGLRRRPRNNKPRGNIRRGRGIWPRLSASSALNLAISPVSVRKRRYLLSILVTRVFLALCFLWNLILYGLLIQGKLTT